MNSYSVKPATPKHEEGILGAPFFLLIDHDCSALFAFHFCSTLVKRDNKQILKRAPAIRLLLHVFFFLLSSRCSSKSLPPSPRRCSLAPPKLQSVVHYLSSLPGSIVTFKFHVLELQVFFFSALGWRNLGAT